MTKPPSAPPNLLAMRLMGVLLIVGLSAGGLFALFALQTWLLPRDVSPLKAVPDVLLTWREGRGLFWAVMPILMAPLILLPPAFGLEQRGVLVGPRLRWSLTAVAAACVAGGIAWGVAFGRDEIVVATPFGVSWLYDRKPVEHWSWGAADQVGVGCVVEPGENGAPGKPVLNYDVGVPSGREANLVRDDIPIPRLIARLTPIDLALRARQIPRFANVEAACLKHYDQGLTDAERAALRMLLSR